MVNDLLAWRLYLRTWESSVKGRQGNKVLRSLKISSMIEVNPGCTWVISLGQERLCEQHYSQ